MREILETTFYRILIHMMRNLPRSYESGSKCALGYICKPKTALLQDAPRSELIKQGQVIIHERTVLPGVQKSRERHLFLFETCLILCKKNEAKEYISRTSIPISKLSFDRNSDSFSVWGSGSRVNLKPTDGSSTDDWIQRIR